MPNPTRFSVDCLCPRAHTNTHTHTHTHTHIVLITKFKVTLYTSFVAFPVRPQKLPPKYVTTKCSSNTFSLIQFLASEAYVFQAVRFPSLNRQYY